MRLLALLVVLSPVTARHGAAQTRRPSTGARLVAVRAEPVKPSFGEAFDLHVTLRMRSAVIAFLPDTLLPTDAVQSVRGGVWSKELAPGDSVGVRATYPVIGFREGRVELPSMEVFIRPGATGEPVREGALRRVAEVRPGMGAGLERRVIRLGAIEIGPFGAMADAGTALAPQPPADVIGRNWSLSLILAVGLASVVGLFGAWVIGRRWWAAAALAARLRRGSPREEALRELERIRALGWHRDGRIDDFYASSTGALRRFAATKNSAWGAALTSTELLAKLAGRWPGGVESLASTVTVAERVKFGRFRPDAEAAEGDWEAIFKWVRDAPEA